MKENPSGSLPPLVLLLPFFAAGLLFCNRMQGRSCPFHPVFWFLLFTAGIISVLSGSCISSRLCRNSTGFRQLLPGLLLWAGAATAVFAAGAVHSGFYEKQLETSSRELEMLAERGGRHVISARIIRAPVLSGGRMMLVAAAGEYHSPGSTVPIHGRLSITVPAVPASGVAVGDIVRFSASLRKIRNFKTPGTFDYENWWALRGIRVKAYVPESTLFLRTGHENVSADLSYPRFMLESARFHLMRLIREGLSGEASAVAAALLFGNRGDISPATREAFSATGAGHLLAVSGLHMAFAAMLLFSVIRWCLLRSEWLSLRIPVGKTATAFSMAAVVIYAGLAGFSPSATRAMVMILIFSMAFLLDRPYTPLNSLAAAGWILLVISPLYIRDMAFQFSFAAVFFLIIFASRLRIPAGDLSMRQRVYMYWMGVAAVTLIAVLATAPVAAWYFQRISFAGPVINLLLVPLTCFMILPFLMAGALTAPVSLAAAVAFFWRPAEFFINGMLKAVDFTAGLPWCFMWIPRPHVWHMIGFWAALFMCAMAMQRGFSSLSGRRFLAAAFIVLLMMPAGTALENYYSDAGNDMVLHLLDVGQGTCQVVELPGRRLLVMDAGGTRSGSFDTGSRIVAPFIRGLGYTHIDILAASHPETDHIGGLPALVRQFMPGELWTNTDRNPGNSAWEELVKAVADTGTARRVFQHDADFMRYGVRFQLFVPEGCTRACSRNARSLVLRLSFQDCSFLLTGDIDRVREACLVHKMPGTAQVLVVPHHGSRTSSSMEFISCFRPWAALISAGYRNRLGLPAPDTVRRYRNAGALVMSTAGDGTLTAAVHNGSLSISTCLPLKRVQDVYPSVPDNYREVMQEEAGL